MITPFLLSVINGCILIHIQDAAILVIDLFNLIPVLGPIVFCITPPHCKHNLKMGFVSPNRLLDPIGVAPFGYFQIKNGSHLFSEGLGAFLLPKLRQV